MEGGDDYQFAGSRGLRLGQMTAVARGCPVKGLNQFAGSRGLSCATSELASAGDGGMFIELDQVPLRDPTLSPEEILMSESQERMMAVVEPRHVEPFLGLVHNPPNRSPNQRPLQLLNGQK